MEGKSQLLSGCENEWEWLPTLRAVSISVAQGPLQGRAWAGLMGYQALGRVLDVSLHPPNSEHVSQAQPAPQGTAKETEARRRPPTPSVIQLTFIKGPLCVPTVQTGVQCEHGCQDPALRGQGCPGLLCEAATWEQSPARREEATPRRIPGRTGWRPSVRERYRRPG